MSGRWLETYVTALVSLFLVRYARACIVICCASILGHILGLYIADTSRFNESADWNSFVLACIGGHSAVCTWPVCLMA